MTNNEYLKEQLEIFKKKCNPKSYFISNQKSDNDVKQVWKETQEYWKREYQNVNSKEQILSYLESFRITLERIEEDRKHWNHFQRTDMMQSLYFVVESIEKAVVCYDNQYCKFDFTKKEIEELFVELEILREKMVNINMLRAMQD